LSTDIEEKRKKREETIRINEEKRKNLELELKQLNHQAIETIVGETTTATIQLTEKILDTVGINRQIRELDDKIAQRSCWASCLPSCCKSKLDLEIDEQRKKLQENLGKSPTAPSPEEKKLDRRTQIIKEISEITDPPIDDLDILEEKLSAFQQRLEDSENAPEDSLTQDTMLEFVRINHWVRALKGKHQPDEKTPLIKSTLSTDLDEIIKLLDSGLDNFYYDTPDDDTDFTPRYFKRIFEQLSSTEKQNLLNGTATNKAELQRKIFAGMGPTPSTPPMGSSPQLSSSSMSLMSKSVESPKKPSTSSVQSSFTFP